MLGHQTPLYGDDFRLNGCPVSLSHYTQYLPAGARANRASAFTLRLQDEELLVDSTLVNTNLDKTAPYPRVDETVLPTSFSDIRYYLHCPMDYRFRREWGFSPSIPELFGYGRAVHVAIEKLHELYPDRAPTAAEAAAVVESSFHLKHIAPSGDPENRPGAYERAKTKSVQIAQEYVADFAADFENRRQVEARFEIPAADCLITGSIDLLLHESQDGTIKDAEVVDFKAMEAGSAPFANQSLDWMALSLQVQLYAKAAREVLGEHASVGSVHLLKDNQRINVPTDEEAVNAAVKNVEWAVQGILARHFPMRPHQDKCSECDFKSICEQRHENFHPNLGVPPPVHTPQGKIMAQAITNI